MVKRYNCDDYLTESAMGCWVGYTDYESLLIRHRDLVAALETIECIDDGQQTEGLARAQNIAYEALRKTLPESP